VASGSAIDECWRALLFYWSARSRTAVSVSAAVRERVERRVDVVKVLASGGLTTPGTDVMGTTVQCRGDASSRSRVMVEIWPQ
jgi:hypothetical protein